MKAFWWFKENSIAGMARPGFNAAHWSDLPFEEGILFGWLGQFSNGPVPLSSLRHHLTTYAPRVFNFFRLDNETGQRALKVFDDEVGTMNVMSRLAERTQSFCDLAIREEHVHFSVNENRVFEEISHLKHLGIRRVVSLTEHHHHKDILADHFELHHLGIADLGAPTREQAHQLAEVVERAEEDREIVAVHCLAGIGRTSTMLLAAHLILGENLDDLKRRIAERNPTFMLVGSQAEFIHNIVEAK
jgi:protein-tyrosine phosphatase